jgi:hypothetical protein
MRGAIPPLPQYAFMAWCLVKKHRDNFTFLRFTVIDITISEVFTVVKRKFMVFLVTPYYVVEYRAKD